jgi:hypothetical protein
MVILFWYFIKTRNIGFLIIEFLFFFKKKSSKKQTKILQDIIIITL